MTQGLQAGISMLPPPPLVEGGGGMATSSPVGSPVSEDKPKRPSEEQLNRFGQFAGSGDTKEIAQYLMKKGLKGAEQLYTDHPNIDTAEGIKTAQSDWKPAAISQMLIQARALGIKTPEGVTANKEALMASMPDRIKQALKHPVFERIHSNFWDVFKDLLKERYEDEAKSKDIARK